MSDAGPTSGTPNATRHVCAMELEHCLEVGLDVFLDPNPGHQSSKRFPAKVRGWESGRYMIVGLASGSPAPVVRQGKECVIRFMHEGEVWGFSALFAEQIQSGAYPLIQLYWPSEVARVQVRKHERVAVQAPCKAKMEDGNIVQGMIGDLSGGGCSLMLNRDLPLGTTLQLSFRMPDGGSVNDRPIIIRNRKDLPGQGTKYGCQFQVAEEIDHGIELFVARKIAIDRGESAPHPQILVLTRDEADVETAQQALVSSTYEVVEAAGILDLGYRLRTCAAEAILVSFNQKELSALEVLVLIRQSPGMEEMPLILYGNSAEHGKAMERGATMCLNSLTEANQILSKLPRQQEPPAPAPTDGGGAVSSAPAAAMGDEGATIEAETDDEISMEE